MVCARTWRTKSLHDVGNATLHQEENANYELSEVQVDKTYVGKRKHNRGRRQPKECWWLVTNSEVIGRKSGRTHWKLVKTRAKATLENFILISERSLVVFDCWSGRLILGNAADTLLLIIVRSSLWPTGTIK